MKKEKSDQPINKPDFPDILILGIGNFIMGDEGIGVHAIKTLEREEWPENFTVLDGGTGGFHLMEHLEKSDLVIMIDATMDGKSAGTISLIKPRFSSDFPTALSAHDIGLKDMIESLIILDKLPEMFLFTVSIEEIKSMCTELSSDVRNSIPDLSKQIRSLSEKILQEKVIA